MIWLRGGGRLPQKGEITVTTSRKKLLGTDELGGFPRWCQIDEMFTGVDQPDEEQQAKREMRHNSPVGKNRELTRSS
jgi:hypothetical protein